MNTGGMPAAAALALAAAIFTYGPASAVGIETFDRNGDGKICIGDGSGVNEMDALNRFLTVRKHAAEFFVKADKNMDGRHSEDEDRNYESMLAEEAEYFQINLDDLRDGADCLEVTRLEREYMPEKPKAFSLGGLILRDSHEDITILDPEKSQKKAKGALFSYIRDFENSNDIWTARGALMYPISLDTASEDSETACLSGNFELSGISFTPSVSFDRVSNGNDSAKDVDSLAFRGGIQLEFCGGIFDTQYLTVWGTYNTDFGFDSTVLALEVDYAPEANRLGLGGANFIMDGALAYRWSAVAHLEYGETVDAGGKAKLVEGEEFLRFGPKLGFDFWIEEGFAKNLHAYANWNYLHGFIGTPKSSDLFKAGLEYPLDASGQFTINVDYRNGDIPLVQDETEDLTIGFRVKF